MEVQQTLIVGLSVCVRLSKVNGFVLENHLADRVEIWHSSRNSGPALKVASNLLAKLS